MKMYKKSRLPVVQLDSCDLGILNVLQKNNATAQRVIGRAVNLSAPAVQRRIRRLEDSGVILANVAVLDPNKLGPSITLIVEVQLESGRIEMIDKAKRRFASAQEVQQCYYVTGEADFVLVIVVPTMTAYDHLTRSLFFADHNVKHFRTLVVMDRIKAGMTVPLDSRYISGAVEP